MAAPLKLLIGPLVFARPQPPLSSLSGLFPSDQTRYIHHLVFACRPHTLTELSAQPEMLHHIYLCNKHCSPHLEPVSFLSFHHLNTHITPFHKWPGNSSVQEALLGLLHLYLLCLHWKQSCLPEILIFLVIFFTLRIILRNILFPAATSIYLSMKSVSICDSL